MKNIIETLEELRKEIALLGNFYCKQMEAFISEAQCIKSQKRCKLFYENTSEYFQPSRYAKKPNRVLRNVRYGADGSSVYFSPLALACRECYGKRMDDIGGKNG